MTTTFAPETCDWCSWEGRWLVRHMAEEHPPCECSHLKNEHIAGLGCAHGWDNHDEWGDPLGCLCNEFRYQDGGEP